MRRQNRSEKKSEYQPVADRGSHLIRIKLEGQAAIELFSFPDHKITTDDKGRPYPQENVSQRVVFVLTAGTAEIPGSNQKSRSHDRKKPAAVHQEPARFLQRLAFFYVPDSLNQPARIQ